MAETTKQVATKKTPQGKAKETKEIKLDFLMMCRRRAEIYKREEKAREYISQCRKKEREKYKIISEVIIGVAAIMLVVCMAIKVSNAEASEKRSEPQVKTQTYTMQGELQGNHVVLEDGNIHEVGKEYANYTSEAMQVTVRLNDNGTANLDDDIILDIR